MKDFEELKQRLLVMPQKRRVAVVPAQDEHTLQAVAEATKDGMVEPWLIGDEPEIRRILSEIGADAGVMRIIDIKDPAEAIRRAADLANAGEVDCIMKGKTETGSLMKVLVNKEYGIRKNKVMSVAAFVDSPHYHKVFAITDPGMLIYPTKEQKKEALANVVEAFHKLGVAEPKAAILAAVERVNPKMKECVEAAEIKEEGVPGCIIEGPISYDLAMDPQSAPIKGYQSQVAGDADILVVPDIVSGNIAIKSLTVLGGVRSGGVVLGAKVPVLLVSRSATADDKYMSIVLAALIGKI